MWVYTFESVCLYNIITFTSHPLFHITGLVTANHSVSFLMETVSEDEEGGSHTLLQ